MINKSVLQSVIKKYHLGENESVKWNVKDNNVDIDFISPSKDVIGKVTATNFKLPEGAHIDGPIARFRVKSGSAGVLAYVK